MNGQSIPPMLIPAATTPQWVPFPGTKRKAESDCREYAPPPKIFAYEEDCGEAISNNQGFTSEEQVVSSNCGFGSPEGRPSLLEGDADEEMKDDPNPEASGHGCCPTTLTTTTVSTDFNYAGAPFSIDIGSGKKHHDGDGRMGLGVVQHEHVVDDDDDDFEDETCNSDFNNSPKLYLLEGLREVLSSKPNADLMLEKVLRKEASKNNNSATSRTTALVLWKDPAQITQPFCSSSPRLEKFEEQLHSRGAGSEDQDTEGETKSETRTREEFDDDDDQMEVLLS